ncbi:MAG: parallel beta-helix domain-containing protein [Pseudomonadota bacterium]
MAYSNATIWGAALAAVLLATTAQAKTLSVAAGPDAQERLQTALLDAKPGDVVSLGAGKFDFSDGLSLDVDNVTVAGAGEGKTILSFAGQKSAGEGLLITSDGVTVRDLTLQDTKGDGVKSKGADRISFVALTVEWTGGPKETNGAYGVYPVASTNVLIDKVTVRGASDAGIYVGQSKNIIVRNSRAEFNVAGIEIENSTDADVFDNVATHNTGGILVFDLPGLPVMGGHSTRIYRNQVVDNDTANFAPKGNIVANVPVGVGVMLMANRDVHVFENDISGNQTSAVLLVAFSRSFDDKSYNPLPRDIVVRDNKLGRNGWLPSLPGGKALAAATGGSVPPVMWDGVTSYPGVEGPAPRLYLKDGPVLNLNLAKAGEVETAKPTVTATLGAPGLPERAAVVLPVSQDKPAS